MNIIIVDDEKVYLQSIEHKLNDWCHKNAQCSGIMLYSFTSSEDAADEIRKGRQVDAAFLDIEIPGEMNGMSFANEIHSYNEQIPIVFITNYAEYALEGYKVNALRFLHKPITDPAIYECMDIIWKRWKLLNSNCITFDTGTQALRIPVDNIIYIEVLGHYSTITTTDDKRIYKFKMTLNEISSKLPKQIFVQSHRCYIVNLMYIRHINGNLIYMSNGTELTVSRTYRNELMKRFREFYLKG